MSGTLPYGLRTSLGTVLVFGKFPIVNIMPKAKLLAQCESNIKGVPPLRLESD